MELHSFDNLALTFLPPGKEEGMKLPLLEFLRLSFLLLQGLSATLSTWFLLFPRSSFPSSLVQNLGREDRFHITIYVEVVYCGILLRKISQKIDQNSIFLLLSDHALALPKISNANYAHALHIFSTLVGNGYHINVNMWNLLFEIFLQNLILEHYRQSCWF